MSHYLSGFNATTVLNTGSLGHSDNPYNYTPTRSVAIIFITLFSISSAVHGFQALFYRMWWLLPTAFIAGLIEVFGWSARLWSTFNPSNIKPFQMQITGTILAPTPLIAAYFIILGKIIERLGPNYSRISPRLYAIIFCSCDLISLVIQGLGGGMASAALGQHRNANKGGNVMLGGIVFQLITITVYSSLATEFLIRYLKDIPIRTVPKTFEGNVQPTRGFLDRKLKLLISAMTFETLCLFIRSIYRTIELSNGWTGRIIRTQVYFNVLDGAMVVLAIFALNFFHPGFLLTSARSSSDPKNNEVQEPKTSGDDHQTLV